MSSSPDEDLAGLPDLPLERLVGLVAGAVAFVAALEEDDGDAAGRLAALNRANEDLTPLVFTPLSEPRRLVAGALRMIDGRMGLLNEVASAVLQRTRVAITAVVLVELLIAADATDGAALAMLCAERFGAAGGPERARLQAGLLQLAGRSSGAAGLFALCHRLRRAGGLTEEGTFTALRMLATRHPDKLRLGLGTLRDEIEAEAVSIVRLRGLVVDIGRRASREAFLLALTSIDPRSFPRLAAAAFGGEAPPFEVYALVEFGDAARLDGDETLDEAVRGVIPAEVGTAEMIERHRLIIGWAETTLDLADFLPGEAALFWYRSLLNATGSAPASRARKRGSSGEFVIEVGFGPSPAVRGRSEAPEKPSLVEIFFDGLMNNFSPKVEMQFP